MSFMYGAALCAANFGWRNMDGITQRHDRLSNYYLQARRMWQSAEDAFTYLLSETARHVFSKTGLSQLQWACLYLPVLAIEQGIDITGNSHVSVFARLFRRRDLCAFLNVDPDLPIGHELWRRGTLTNEEATLVDTDLFAGRRLLVELRIDRDLLQAESLWRELQETDVIDRMEMKGSENGYLFVCLVTRRFSQLANAFSCELPDRAVLVSLDAQILHL